jgi:hypothetical protein
MSDRTQGSVRTGSKAGEGSAPAAAPDEAAPVSATQSIPSTGAQRAQSASGAAGADGAAAGNGPATTGGPAAETPAAANAGDHGVGLVGGKRGDRAGEAGRARGGKGKGKDGRGPRRARLQLRHVDTWSALKISLVLSIALFFIWMVAVGILYGVLNGLGVFDTLNDLFGQVGSVSGSENTGDVITPGVVFGGAAVIGAINIVLMTALCTVATFIYNLCSDLVGGLEITLSERD